MDTIVAVFQFCPEQTRSTPSNGRGFHEKAGICQAETVISVSPLIPARLASACQNDLKRLAWLNNLPSVIRDLEQRWSLTVGNPFDSDQVSCSWVAPASRADQLAVILKLGMPHMEAEHENHGLRFWDGNPTVRLLAADDDAGALLLERCEPGTSLRELPEPEQDIVIARLLRRLWRMPLASHPFRPLSVMTEDWGNQSLAQAENWRDPSLVFEGLRLFKELSQAAAGDMLLATDLHAGNVLRAQREPWLVIDPKPFIGDPAYDATQHLFNCYSRLLSDPEGTIRRFAGLLDLDSQRILLWTFARAAVAAGDQWQDDRWILLARALARIIRM